MSSEFVLAVFLIGVGLSVAGAGTHLYQAVRREPAMLRFDGRTVFGMFGHLIMSFVCGPYIMLMLGWRTEPESPGFSMTSGLISAFVAFGWSFLTGMLLVGAWLALIGA